jgi:TolB-like protein/tRNA A-37 threonylcarbamoyl transferase component Bud32
MEPEAMSAPLPGGLAAALADRYRNERELGAGGMATVYLAEDLKHHRQVAVKVLRPELAASLGSERFLREVTIAANLQHPHVVPLYDSGHSDGFLYYVMPYVEGTSLRQKLLREGELPIVEAVRILRDVADAMAYAHLHGVVHRDIKPENVMLSGRHALVTDFGVAKAVSQATGRQTLTTAGVALGTPAYMCPEQAAADPHTDHRADIYAFGVVAYELLTGRPPFTGGSPQAVLSAHVTMAPDPVTRHRASIPPILAALVMRCLEKKSADRPQSADELIPQLEAVLTPSGGMTPTDTKPHQAAARPATRRRWLIGAAAGVLLTGGAIAGVARMRYGAGGRIEKIGVMPIEDISGKDSLFAASMHDALTNALARSRVSGVAPRSEMMRYRRSPKTTREIAKELDLGAVVETTVFRAGEVMRINVQLTDPRTSRSLWSDTYERNVSNVLAAQSDVVSRISTGIGGVLNGPQASGDKR